MSDAIQNGARRCLRVAAAGDLHCDEHRAAALIAAVNGLEGSADLLLLAGDLTTLGEPEQLAPLAEACGALSLPTVAVLGNHDVHGGRTEELVGVLERAGVHFLERGTWCGEA
ncbi:MAG TPA: metallophosphoesterase, partial [Solirubrobacteraceae bacterium]|nr:metallophosphoesterase [Solirubrobacteraceae bacterium]